MKYLIIIFSFFNIAISAQKFADKEYYLVDSLVLEDLSEKEFKILDSCLTIYHEKEKDTSKIRVLRSLLGENINIDLVFKYKNYIIDYCRYKTTTNLPQEESQFYYNELVGSLNNYANKLLLYGKMADALDCFKQVLSFSNKISRKDEISSSLTGIAVVYESQGNSDSSIIYLKKSLLIVQGLGNQKEIGECYNNIGYIYDNKGEFSKALDYYFRSLAIQKAIGNKEGIGYSYNSLGYIYERQEDLPKALDYYLKAEKTLKEIDDIVGYGVSLNSLGHIFKKQKQIDKALEYFKKSLKIQEEIGNIKAVTTNLNSIGGLYEEQKDFITALEYYNKSLILNQSSESKYGLAISLNYVARAEFELGLISDAKAKIIQSISIAKEIGYPGIISPSSLLLAKIYEKQNNYKQALDLYQLHIKMRDSIKNEKNLKAIIEQATKFEYDKKKVIGDAEHEKQLLLEHESQKRQKIITLSVSIGLLLVVFFLIFVYRRLQITKIQKLVIEQKKKEVEEQKIVVETAHKETERQKEVVEYQKAEVEVINEKLEEISKEISDSINYAEMIQQAVLPSLDLEDLKNEAFIYFNPKDRVSGDFYWLEQQDEYSGYCVADCTGHGIPGAFISMVGTILLNEIHNSKGINIPNQILDELSRLVKLTLTNKEGYTMKDGMDLSFVLLNNKTKILHFSAANSPIWIASSEPQKVINKELVNPNFEQEGKYIYEIKGNKQPIGDYGDMAKPFTLHNAKLIEGDCFYLFSDGYVDQFGGERNKKFKAKAFRELLLSVNNESMEEQHKVLEQTFLEWKKDTEQIDDVTVMGVRV